jgi:hypothetical protein
MRTSESIKEISPALIKVQTEIQNVLNTSANPFFKSKYAPLDEILNYCRPIITKHGLAIIQSPGSVMDVPISVGVTTRIIHSSGEWIEDTIFVPLPVSSDNKKINFSQEAGIIVTYLRRYSITAFLGIAGEADTDGNYHGDKPETKKESAPEIDMVMIEVGKEIPPKFWTLSPEDRKRFVPEGSKATKGADGKWYVAMVEA